MNEISMASDITNQMLSDIAVFNKYAKFIPELERRETWHEVVTRNMTMHLEKYPALEIEIRKAYKYVYHKEVLPSMRSMQFGGRPIELSNNRIYNCAYMPIDHEDAFSELMFLLLGGTGVGYSVQQRHIRKLPTVRGVKLQDRKYVVSDTIEGWADAVKVLVEAFFYNKHTPRFDLSDIRPKGARLVTSGGKAPGPEPLRICLNLIREKLDEAVGRKLRPIEVHDICCIIANAVLTGGIRRAAMISLFDRDDEEMLTCKTGNWYEKYEYRGRSNNSAMLPRGKVSKEELLNILKYTREYGEPGVVWTNNLDWGVNPCGEVGLRPFQFCNLCEINVSNISSQFDLNQRSKAAAFIGTLQATYTDFHYLRPIWRETTEAEALIGVGMTGIASGAILKYSLAEAAGEVVAENERAASLLRIRPAARCTTIKPSGTSSLVCATSSGIHAWHSEYYIRRMKLGKNESLAKYLIDHIPKMIEPDELNDSMLVASFPQRAPKGVITRKESAEELLERVKHFNENWVRPGHISGVNPHNVSCTVNVKDHEWDLVGEWMWENKDSYTGITVLSHFGGKFPQMPFEEITETQFNKMLENFHALDLTEIRESDDNTDLSGEAACAGGLCEIV